MPVNSQVVGDCIGDYTTHFNCAALHLLLCRWLLKLLRLDFACVGDRSDADQEKEVKEHPF
jgi:hypothetical protein